MKFVGHLAKVVNQNSWLKIVSGVLGTLLVFSICVIFTLALRKPLIIERSCDVRVSEPSNKTLTEDEIRIFIRKFLPERFDTNLTAEKAYFEDGEILAREKEQTQLKERNILQRVLINEIDIKDDIITVKADRLISVGEIRSVLPLDLKVRLRQDTRTASNPYGLIITKIEQSNPKKE